MGRGKTKGGSFEREMCRVFSEWWTDGERDDVFWRSASSGGRSTQRKKKGKQTFGHAGDMTAADPIGQPLLQAITFEFKVGYSSHTLSHLLDKSLRAAPRMWDKWILQARESAKQAGSKGWAVVHRRNGQKATITMNRSLYLALFDDNGNFPPKFECYVRIPKSKTKYVSMQIVAMTLDQFLSFVTPDAIRSL